MNFYNKNQIVRIKVTEEETDIMRRTYDWVINVSLVFSDKSEITVKSFYFNGIDDGFRGYYENDENKGSKWKEAIKLEQDLALKYGLTKEEFFIDDEGSSY